MRTYILFITLLCTLSLKAQIVDCTPSKPTGDDEVTVTFDLTKCSFQKASLVDFEGPIYSDRKSTRLNSSHTDSSRMPSSA